MKLRDRTIKIVQILRENRFVPVSTLSQALGVSQMTVRRDLKQLERMGVIERSYGGANLKPERGDVEWPLSLRQTERLPAKQKIGAVAAGLIRDGDVVIIDAGSTTLQVAHHLYQNRLTVASNFLPILNLLADRQNVSLVCIGGMLYQDNMCFLGPIAVSTIRSINANVAIIATSCLSLSKGMTNRNITEAETKRAMIEVAEKVVLVMDSSKMHHHMLASVGPLEAIDVLVTDDDLAPDDRAAIEARGVKVLVVPCAENVDEPDRARSDLALWRK